MNGTVGRRMHRFLLPAPKLGQPINPALLKREQERAEARQNRLADSERITVGCLDRDGEGPLLSGSGGHTGRHFRQAPPTPM